MSSGIIVSRVATYGHSSELARGEAAGAPDYLGDGKWDWSYSAPEIGRE